MKHCYYVDCINMEKKIYSNCKKGIFIKMFVALIY